MQIISAPLNPPNHHTPNPNPSGIFSSLFFFVCLPTTLQSDRTFLSSLIITLLMKIKCILTGRTGASLSSSFFPSVQWNNTEPCLISFMPLRRYMHALQMNFIMLNLAAGGELGLNLDWHITLACKRERERE